MDTSNSLEWTAPYEIGAATPVRIPAGSLPATQSNFVLQLPDGTRLPAQRDGDAVVAVLSGIAASTALRFTVLEDEASGGVSLREGDGELGIGLPEGDFGTYHYGSEVVRPYIWPLLGPSQKPMTRVVKKVNDDEADHPHHRSLFTAYEEANGANNWNELEGHGYTRHQKFLAKESGPVFGGFTALGLWTNHEGKPVLTETRRVRLYNVGSEVRLLDYEVRLAATHGEVEFGETKEAGILGIRVNPTMNGSWGGLITNSEGGREEAECWGRKATWCDYSGEVDGEVMGITVFDHPSNPNYPTRWHVRNYGLFATNPFSTASFNAGEATPYLLASGEEAVFRYRILLHRGSGESALLHKAAEAFAKS